MRKTAAIRAAGVSVWERRSTCRVARAASPHTVAAAVPVQGREVEAAAVRVLDQGAGREADRGPVPARGQEREPVREQVLAAVLVVARGRGPALVAAVAAALALVQEWARVQELVVAPAVVVEVEVEVDRGRVAAVALVVERAPAQERAMEPVRETGLEQGAALGRVAARDRVPGVPAVALSSAAGSGMRLHRRGTFLRTVPSSRSTAAM